MEWNRLSLMGDMSPEKKLEECSKALMDSQVRSIQISNQDFENEDETYKLFLELMTRNDRRWSNIKLSGNKPGPRFNSIIKAILGSNTRKLMLSEEPCEILSELGTSLGTNSSLLILGIKHMKLTEASMESLSRGLAQTTSLMEVSFDNSTFMDNSHVALASGLKTCQSIQHLSFKGCGLTDVQCEVLNKSLVRHESILELNFEGNSCVSKGANALALVMQSTNLLVLDLSAQNVSSTSWELSEFSKTLESSRVRYLQFSDNQIDELSMETLALGIKVNRSLRTLNLSWCEFPSTALFGIADSLTQNATISTLNLFNCGISDEGLIDFSTCLSQMKGLKKIDIGGEQDYTEKGINIFFERMANNLALEEVLLNAQNYNKNRIYLDLNRGGRRFFRSKDSAPLGVWPTLLERVQTMNLPKVCDPWAMNHFDASKIDTKSGDFDERESSRRASVLFHLLQNGLLPEL